ncbi:uncharacterized protein LOC131000109 [Salvia miltiorrhiza]|uniref:uncharacterized protein LOC131000109 n=1 Tax=Salvia miltiorrhiza TaxID=226208 RepID=UPI0025AC641A|nr:uncharacterized protein LOC131000109 [Salvia miltiorrhiza]
MSNPSVSLKLLIDAKRGVVLFAETAENLAAVMYGMLSKPETVISLLRQQDTAAGSLTKLCKSIENVDKKSTNGVYCCGYCGFPEYSDDPSAVCSYCLVYMDATMAYVAPPVPAGGSGGKAPRYIITDDLEITPMSAVSIVTLFKRLGIDDVDALEEKVVDFGVDEAIKVVNVSRQSKKVLTEVFLKLKPKPEPEPEPETVKRDIEGTEGLATDLRRILNIFNN